MTLDEAVAIIAVHFGEADENKIEQMSYVFFQEVLKHLGRKLNYDAVVNYAGNSFAKKSWEMISDANPLKPAAPDGHTHNGAMQNLAAFFGSAAVKVKK